MPIKDNNLARDRAKEIYSFALQKEGDFTMKQLPKKRGYTCEMAAIDMLIGRGLIGYASREESKVSFKLIHRVPVERCLEINGDRMPTLRGCTVYKVPPAIAAALATADTAVLQQYTIGEIQQW